MNKLAQRLQKEQPFLLQHAAAVAHRARRRSRRGRRVLRDADLGNVRSPPRCNAAAADRGRTSPTPSKSSPRSWSEDRRSRRQASRTSASRPASSTAQPHIYAKLAELLAEDVKEAAMTPETASTIIKPTEVVIEAFDAALFGTPARPEAGHRRRRRQGRPQRAVPVRLGQEVQEVSRPRRGLAYSHVLCLAQHIAPHTHTTTSLADEPVAIRERANADQVGMEDHAVEDIEANASAHIPAGGGPPASGSGPKMPASGSSEKPGSPAAPALPASLPPLPETACVPLELCPPEPD